VVRSFSGFAAALDEIKNARVFGGIHFRTACNDGTALGSAIGNYVISSRAASEPPGARGFTWQMMWTRLDWSPLPVVVD
jgi:hypothetical protein